MAHLAAAPIGRSASPRDTCDFHRGELIESSHGTIHYQLWGRGDGIRPLVVTVHGLLGTLSTFSGAAKDLVRHGFDVLTFDLFGFGLSASPHERFTAEFYARQVLELLTLLGYHQDCRFCLAGFSMGGLVAMEIARCYPERVSRLLLIAPAGLVPLSKRERMGIRALRTARLLHIPVATVVAKLASHREVDEEAFEPEVQDEQCGRELAERNARLFRSDPEKYTKAWLKSVRDMRLANNGRLYGKVAKCGVEVMFLWGDNDNTVPLDSVQEELRTFFPSAPVLVVNGAGHGLLAEFGDTVAEHAASWFRGGAHALVAPVSVLQKGLQDYLN